jgi:hypothetical protein
METPRERKNWVSNAVEMIRKIQEETRKGFE